MLLPTTLFAGERLTSELTQGAPVVLSPELRGVGSAGHTAPAELSTGYANLLRV